MIHKISKNGGRQGERVYSIDYCWKSFMSEEHRVKYWFNIKNGKRTWFDPPEIVKRTEILNITGDNKNFTRGDTVYYLGGDMTDSKLQPDIVWIIDNISRERKILNLTEMGNPSNQAIFPHFNINLLRHVPDPTIMESEMVGGMEKEIINGRSIDDYLVDDHCGHVKLRGFPITKKVSTSSEEDLEELQRRASAS